MARSTVARAPAGGAPTSTSAEVSPRPHCSDWSSKSVRWGWPLPSSLGRVPAHRSGQLGRGRHRRRSHRPDLLRLPVPPPRPAEIPAARDAAATSRSCASCTATMHELAHGHRKEQRIAAIQAIRATPTSTSPRPTGAHGDLVFLLTAADGTVYAGDADGLTPLDRRPHPRGFREDRRRRGVHRAHHRPDQRAQRRISPLRGAHLTVLDLLQRPVHGLRRPSHPDLPGGLRLHRGPSPG